MIAPVGGLAGAAAVAPGLAVVQWLTAGSISRAAQDARRDVGKLIRRADNLLRLTVADGPARGQDNCRCGLRVGVCSPANAGASD